MTPEEALATIKQAAASFANSSDSIEVLRSVFHSNLHDLCRDGPLRDETLALFEEMERWETSVGPDRPRALDEVREAALRLASSSS